MRVNSVAMSADERYVVSGSWDKTVRVWDWQTPNAAPHVLSGHKSWVSSVALSVDDQYVVSGSGDNTVRVWNIVSGQCLATIQGFNGNVNSVAWRKISNLDYLFTGSGDKAVRCWQLILVDHQWQASLRWTSTQAALTLVGAKIEGVKGLSSMNTRLLKQRGVGGEPAPRLRETSKRVINVVAAVSKFKAPLHRRTLDERQTAPSPSTSPSLPAKEQHLFSHFA
jgi:hypothetical protein